VAREWYGGEANLDLKVTTEVAQLQLSLTLALQLVACRTYEILLPPCAVLVFC
jgi:hypothetical protein